MYRVQLYRMPTSSIANQQLRVRCMCSTVTDHPEQCLPKLLW